MKTYGQIHTHPAGLLGTVNPWALLVFFLTASLAFFLAVEPAFAQAVGGSGSFSCSGGDATGKLYDSGNSCPTVLGADNVFSFLVCNIEHLSSNLMGRMFCGMMHNLAPAVSAALFLAIVLFGVGFTIGVIPATARDFQVFLLKITFVWVFATQSDYIISIGYRFFVDGLRDGVAVALNNFNPSGKTGSGLEVYARLDDFLSVLIGFATDYIGASQEGDRCDNAVFAVMAIMAIAFPPIFFIALALMMQIAITFVRAVFGYIYALVGITFLLTLAPFFLSFYLFRQTRNFFEKWIGYMASFALQIVILFAFLSFILSINVKEISGSFTKLVIEKPIEKSLENASFRAPWEYCTLCEFEVIGPNGNVLREDEQKDFLGGGSLRCKHNPPQPINVLATVSPPKDGGGFATNQQQNALLRFAGAGFMSLLVLAYIIEALLGNVASLAQVLAGGIGGATYAPQLGGGHSLGARPSMGMPGGGLYSDFEDGMTRGFAKGNNGVGAFTEGFKEGMSRLVTGKGNWSTQNSEQGHAGIRDRFLDWLTDPNHLGEQ